MSLWLIVSAASLRFSNKQHATKIKSYISMNERMNECKFVKFPHGILPFAALNGTKIDFSQ